VELQAGGQTGHVDARVRNVSERAVRLASVALGFRWAGHGSGDLRFLRHGWQSWSFTGGRALDERGEPGFSSGAWLRGLHHAVGAPPLDRTGWHESDLLTAIGATPSGPACVVGALERGRAFGVVYVRREAEDVLVEVELVVDGELAPGETRELERVRVALGADPSGLLEEHAEAHGRLAGARAAHPFVSGWCTWYHFFHDVAEADVLRNVEALAAARNEIPIEVVQIDDGYQRAVGDWLEASERFPRGIAPLAAEIRAAGFVPGLWTAPFCVAPQSALFAKRRDWLLGEGAGGGPFRGLVHPAWSPDGSIHVLDTSRDDATGHLRDLFRSLVQMGFLYLKLDFLYTAAMQARAEDPTLSRAARLRRGLEAIRAGAGPEAFLLGCGCPLGAAVGVVDGMRIGPDVAPSWYPEPEVPIPGIEAMAPSTRSAVRNALARSFMNRRLWQNDPDCVMVRSRDTRLTREEVRTLAAAVATTGGMLVFSDDVPRLDREGRRLLREALELARHVDGLGIPGRARALGLLEGEMARGVAASDADAAIVALVNGGDTPRTAEFAAGELGAPGAPPEALLGTRAASAWGGTASLDLAPHESAVARARRELHLAVFCDFDGTFSVQDVGATLAQRLAGSRRPAAWARYERGEITAWEYHMEILDGLPLPATELDAFLSTIELDPGARDLLAWCEAAGVPFRVLSDGFDWNLNRLQVLHGVRFAYDANHLRYEHGRWRIRAGFPNDACGCGTGTCKRGRISTFRERAPGATLIHIGNGRVSDLCGALAADVAFAKDTLAIELEGRGAPFERFRTLRDTIPRLEALLAEAGRAAGQREK
jgi:alpha-galactosidase